MNDIFTAASAVSAIHGEISGISSQVAAAAIVVLWGHVSKREAGNDL